MTVNLSIGDLEGIKKYLQAHKQEVRVGDERRDKKVIDELQKFGVKKLTPPELEELAKMSQAREASDRMLLSIEDIDQYQQARFTTKFSSMIKDIEFEKGALGALGEFASGILIKDTVFSFMSADNQNAITIHLKKGERVNFNPDGKFCLVKPRNACEIKYQNTSFSPVGTPSCVYWMPMSKCLRIESPQIKTSVNGREIGHTGGLVDQIRLELK